MEVNCRNCVHCMVRLKLTPPKKLIPKSLKDPTIDPWFRQYIDYTNSPVRCAQGHWLDEKGNEFQLASFSRTVQTDVQRLHQAETCPDFQEP